MSERVRSAIWGGAREGNGATRQRCYESEGESTIAMMGRRGEAMDKAMYNDMCQVGEECIERVARGRCKDNTMMKAIVQMKIAGRGC